MKIISFDISQKELLKKNDTVVDSDVEPLEASLLQMGRHYNSISRNIQFYQLRERTHRDLAEQTCDRVLWCAIVKMVVLSLISLTQVYTMKGMLGSKATQTI